MNIETIKEQRVIDRVKNRPYLFVGAISFEERCTHICTLLATSGLCPSRSELIDYPTTARPLDMDKELRSKHTEKFKSSLREAFHVINVNPYSASSMRNHSVNIVRTEEDIILIDITCITRGHLISLAGALIEATRPEQEIYFSYTAAESYSVEKEVSGGWRDVLLLPVGNPRSLRREGHARGVVLTGHDAERLSLALNELEPAAGCIIFANTPERPDLMRHAQQVNDSITKYLLRLRMPRAEIEQYDDDTNTWKDAYINLDDYNSLERFAQREIMYASKDQGPLILFPFGPKNLTLSASIILASAKEVNVWAVYPVPFMYDIDYSQRTARVHWMRMVKPGK